MGPTQKNILYQVVLVMTLLKCSQDNSKHNSLAWESVRKKDSFGGQKHSLISHLCWSLPRGMWEAQKCGEIFYGVLGFNTKLLTTLRHGDGSISLWGGCFAARSIKPLKAEGKIVDALRTAKSWRKSCCNWQEHWDIEDDSSFSRTMTWNIQQKPHLSAKKVHVPNRLSQNPDINSIQHPRNVYKNCSSQTVSIQFEPE